MHRAHWCIQLIFYLCVHQGDHHPDWDVEYFYHSKFSYALPSLYPLGDQYSDFYHNQLALLTWTSYKWNLTVYTLLWLVYFIQHNTCKAHLCYHIYQYFLLSYLLCSNFLRHLSTDRAFLLGTLLGWNKAAINILAHIICRQICSFLLDVYLEVELRALGQYILLLNL